MTSLSCSSLQFQLSQHYGSQYSLLIGKLSSSSTNQHHYPKNALNRSSSKQISPLTCSQSCSTHHDQTLSFSSPLNLTPLHLFSSIFLIFPSLSCGSVSQGAKRSFLCLCAAVDWALSAVKTPDKSSIMAYLLLTATD